MKTHKNLTALIVLIITTTFQSCFTSGETSRVTIRGWIDENTFQVSVIGSPNDMIAGKIMKRGTAKEAALLMAQKIIAEKFAEMLLESGTAPDQETASSIIEKEYGSLIKEGNVVSETYDSEDNCQLVYRVEYQNLRKKITRGVK